MIILIEEYTDAVLAFKQAASEAKNQAMILFKEVDNKTQITGKDVASKAQTSFEKAEAAVLKGQTADDAKQALNQKLNRPNTNIQAAVSAPSTQNISFKSKAVEAKDAAQNVLKLVKEIQNDSDLISNAVKDAITKSALVALKLETTATLATTVITKIRAIAAEPNITEEQITNIVNEKETTLATTLTQVDKALNNTKKVKDLERERAAIEKAAKGEGTITVKAAPSEVGRVSYDTAEPTLWIYEKQSYELIVNGDGGQLSIAPNQTSQGKTAPVRAKLENTNIITITANAYTKNENDNKTTITIKRAAGNNKSAAKDFVLQVQVLKLEFIRSAKYISTPKDGKNYKTGEKIQFQIRFWKKLKFENGVPSLKLIIGDKTKTSINPLQNVQTVTMKYVSPQNTSDFLEYANFEHVVQKNDASMKTKDTGFVKPDGSLTGTVTLSACIEKESLQIPQSASIVYEDNSSFDSDPGFITPSRKTVNPKFKYIDNPGVCVSTKHFTINE